MKKAMSSKSILVILTWKSKKIILLGENHLELDITATTPVQNGKQDTGHAKLGKKVERTSRTQQHDLLATF